MNPHEQRILTAVRAGEPVDLRTGEAAVDDPRRGGSWGDDRTLRADMLAELLTTPPTGTGRVRPVKIRGARVSGALDLEAAALTCGLLLRDCHFDEDITLDEADAPALRLPGCRLRGLSAAQLRTTGNIELDHGFTAEGEITLRGAQVGGELSLSGARLTNPGGITLSADQLATGQGMFCRELTTDGEVRLLGAHIGGQLDLEGARLSNPGGTALQANWLTVGHHMLCSGGFTADGAVTLVGARIQHLVLSGATLSNPGGPALNGYGLIVDQNLECRDGFVAEGAVNLAAAQVGGHLNFDGARLSAPGGRALYADALTVGQSLFCRNGFVAEGEVRLIGARVGGVADFTGATLSNRGGRALYAVRLSVDGDLMLRQGFTAEGNVQVSGAQVGGQLELDEARLSSPGGSALTGVQLRVEETLSARDLRVEGTVHMTHAHIGGALSLQRARFTAPGERVLSAEGLTVDRDVDLREFTAEGEVHLTDAKLWAVDLTGAELINPEAYALYGRRLTVSQNAFFHGFSATGCVHLVGAQVGRLAFTDASLVNPTGLALDLEYANALALNIRFRHPPTGGVDLGNAHVDALADDEAGWPANVILRGFTFNTLEKDGIDVRARLRWLSGIGAYSPQPYEQLAAAYQRDGREEAARQVAIAKQWHRRKVLNPIGKVTNWLLYLTVGYGYRTMLAAVWLAGLLAIGTVVFAHSHMTPAGPNAPDFQPFAYTADVLLPIIDLGQQKAWYAHGAALYWSWALIAAGWVLTTAVVAGLSGVIKRD